MLPPASGLANKRTKNLIGFDALLAKTLSIKRTG